MISPARTIKFEMPGAEDGTQAADAPAAALRRMTADRIDVVANVDDFSEIIYERQSDRNWASDFLLCRLAHKVDEDLCQCSIGS